VREFEGELGTAGQLSVAQRGLVKRAAFCGAPTEGLETRCLQGERIEVRDYVPLANLQRRLIETIGIKHFEKSAMHRVEIAAGAKQFEELMMRPLRVDQLEAFNTQTQRS
jgi:hypothetical protein